MKKLTTALTALIILISASAFSTKRDLISDKIKSVFEKTFINATDVKWKKLNEYYLADFTVNNQNASAAFNEKGELLSAARSITLNQMPLIVMLNLQARYPDYTFSNNITELTSEGVTSYFIKAENAKHIVTIKGNALGDLNIEHKTKKK